MFGNKTEVKIIKEINTADSWWCSSAVLFSVKNGKNMICETGGPFNKDYEYYSHLQLNGKPLVQGQYPECPTCKGMLATGYGIENIECPELEAARTCMNSSFVSIMDSAEKIKPLLGLLRDGYYALADTICFPSDGEGRFFYEVPNELQYYDAACYGYYCNWDYSCVDHFPMFLYPTQSASLINNERVEYYARIMRTEDEPPRALAYHLYGFMNALLDGHHKACAAASLGKCVRCLTIIPCDGSRFDRNTLTKGVNLKQSNPVIEKLMFAGLETEAPKGIRYLDVYKDPDTKPDLSFQKYDLTDGRIHYGKASYPTIRDLATLSNAKSIEGLLPDFDPDVISGLVAEDTEEADRYLEAILNCLSATDPEAAYKLAVSIVKKGPGFMRHDRLRSAFLFLLNVKNDETEQLFADYYVDHDGKEHDDIFDIVNSYWKK
jgi:hypothetical protein